MNKLKRLQRKVARDCAIALGVAFGVFVLMMAISMLAEGAAKKKTEAVSQLSQDQAQLNNMRTQYNKSGDAEKRFVSIQLSRDNKDYTANSEAMKDFLRAAKDHYRFTDSFKLSLANEKPSDKPELTGLNYDVSIREPMKIELEAISDVHVFSFIKELMRNSPGFVRVTKIDMKRKQEMTGEIFTQMNNGSAPAQVSATIEFSWVGIQPKKGTAADAKGAPAP